MSDDRTDEILGQLERRGRASHAAVLDILHEAGRPDLAGELEAKFRDIRTGVDGARATWHSISAAQRRVLETLEPGRWLVRAPASKTRFAANGSPHAVANVCGIATVRNLTARELLACDGGVFDPEAKLVLTGRARFVLAHGRPALQPPPVSS